MPALRLTERRSYAPIAKRGFLWGLGQEAFNELIHIPTLVVLARLLSPYEFGITAAAGFFVSFANRFTKFGFNVALVRMKHVEPAHSSSVFVISVGMGLVSWAALTFGSPWIGRFFDSPEAGQVLPIAAFTFVIAAVGTVPSAMMTTRHALQSEDSGRLERDRHIQHCRRGACVERVELLEPRLCGAGSGRRCSRLRISVSAVGGQACASRLPR